ncbi:sensor domain-containing protein [Streptomyces sp. NPDC049555]|uniref:sensor histidine kinase n=1 Tax=unclassified Streptomyces TaxID=2593676 RepID=UPI00341CF9CD
MALPHGHTAPAAPRRPRVPVALRAPLAGRTWREFLYVMLGLPIAVFTFAYGVVMTTLSVGLLVTFLGVPLLAGTLAGARGLGALERARARALLGLRVGEPEPVRPRPARAGRRARGGLMTWVGALLKSGTSWRNLLYTVLCLPWAIFSFVVAVVVTTVGWLLFLYPAWQWVPKRYVGHPGIQLYGDSEGHAYYVDTPFEVGVTCVLGLLLVLAMPWVLRGLTAVNRLLVSGLLGPSVLAARVSELEEDRGVAVDTAAADLRRIERDLHDGAQARLAALAMDLGMAKDKAQSDPQAAARLVDEAHGEVKLALQELRDLARGIHPAILTDRGLGPALSSVAARCAVPVTVTVELPDRPAPAIEGIAYFTVSELLQNISKHSHATRAEIRVHKRGNRLHLRVTDNGHGGATTAHGSGLAGLAERLGSVDGALTLDSPAGGPTTVTAELPWRSR